MVIHYENGNSGIAYFRDRKLPMHLAGTRKRERIMKKVRLRRCQFLTIEIPEGESILNKPDYIAMCANHAGFIEDQGWKPGALGEWEVAKAEGFD